VVPLLSQEKIKLKVSSIHKIYTEKRKKQKRKFFQWSQSNIPSSFIQ